MNSEFEKLIEGLYFNGEMWWTKEDMGAYDYLKGSHITEMQTISQFLTGKDVAVQAGAHCGYVINELETIFNTIYAFEPDSIMFLALCMNVPNKNVFKIQACLGEEHKLVSLVQNEACKISGANYVSGVGKVPMFMIDDLNLNKCDLIMLDTEGYEYMALLGAKNTIEKFKPLLCLERYWMPRTTGLPESVLDDQLRAWGYVEVARAGESDYIYQFRG